MVFWDNLLRQLDDADPATASLLREHAYTWHDQVVIVDGRAPVTVPSYGYSLRRRHLLELLRARAIAVGARIEDRRISGLEEVSAGADLVIASDGVHSTLRSQQQAAFGTRLSRLRNHYIWLGSDREFDAFTFPFVPTPAGWLWAHAYGFDTGASTFVVETSPETWAGLGFDRMDPGETVAALEQHFAEVLDGARLHPPAGTRDRTPWNRFLRVRNRRWSVGNLALMGDAAHTTHFTIGSGTRLAMEDAIVLASALAQEPSVPAALAAYETDPAAAAPGRAARRPAQRPLVRERPAVPRPLRRGLRPDDGRPPLARDGGAAGRRLPEADPHGQRHARRRRTAAPPGQPVLTGLAA